MPEGLARIVGRLSATAPAGEWIGSAYRRLTIALPAEAGFAERARPGQFVAFATGGETTAHLLRRVISIHRVDPAGSAAALAAGATEHEDALTVILAPKAEGTRWLAAAPVGTPIDVLGPGGRPFPAPAPGACVLVGGGYGTAPLFWQAEHLLCSGHAVGVALGAADATRLVGLEAADGLSAIAVTTDDGSYGRRGLVTAPLGPMIKRLAARTIYACGPMGMLKSVASVAHAHGATAYVTVEEAMACGAGLCMTCVMPVRDAAGTTAMRRTCTDGPTFDAAAVRWDAFVDGRTAVPADCVGAPRQVLRQKDA